MINVPTITVITATLNSAALLPHLLDSLRRQNDREFDCVIVDGGSEDGSTAIAASYHDVVTRIICEPDNGIYDALNKGIRAACTDFYIVMGADDLLYPDAISNFKTAAFNGTVDVVVAAVKAGNRIRRGFHRKRAWLGHPAMVTSHSVGMLIKKQLHERFGFYSLSYPSLADGVFIKRISKAIDVNIIAASFVAGVFGTSGISNQNFVKALGESWQVQLDTGENPFLQYLLFQMRLLRNLPRVVGRRPNSQREPTFHK